MLLFFPTTAIKKTFALLLSSLYVHYECTSEKNKEGERGWSCCIGKKSPYCCAFHTHCACIEEQEKSFHLLLADTVDCRKTIACHFSIFRCQKYRLNVLSTSCKSIKCFSGKSRQINATIKLLFLLLCDSKILYFMARKKKKKKADFIIKRLMPE